MTQATIAEAEQTLEDEFALFDDWRDKIEYVLELGKSLPPMDTALKTEATKVKGCQSQVWLVARHDEEAGVLRLNADSDAMIVKGLIAMLMRLYDGQPPQAIRAHPPAVFERIGLGRHISTQRAGGLAAMIKRIDQLAERESQAA